MNLCERCVPQGHCQFLSEIVNNKSRFEDLNLFFTALDEFENCPIYEELSREAEKIYIDAETKIGPSDQPEENGLSLSSKIKRYLLDCNLATQKHKKLIENILEARQGYHQQMDESEQESYYRDIAALLKKFRVSKNSIEETKLLDIILKIEPSTLSDGYE